MRLKQKTPLGRMREMRGMHQRPADVIVASRQPFAIKEVLQLGGFRFAVKEQLTEQEFRARMARNKKRREEQERDRGFQWGEQPGQGSFTAAVDGSVAVPGTDESADTPDPDMKYFYAMEPV